MGEKGGMGGARDMEANEEGLVRIYQIEEWWLDGLIFST